KKQAAPPQEQPAGNAEGRSHMAEKTDGAEPKISKLEAVRRAMAELGNKAQRGQIKDFIKERFGIEMTPDHISTSKGEIPRKRTQARTPTAKAVAAKEPARPQAQRAPAPAAPPARAEGGIALEDIAAAKALVDRVGAEQLRALIEVLAR